MNPHGGLAAALAGLALGVVEFGGVAILVRRMKGRPFSTLALWIVRLAFVFAAAAWLLVRFKLMLAHFVLGYFLSIFALLAWGVLTNLDENNKSHDAGATPKDQLPPDAPHDS